MKKKIKLSNRIFLFNKKFKKKEFYHYIKGPDVSLIIPIIKNKFLIVSQRREPINKTNYEFPSGWIDKNETAEKSACRELFEETGYRSLQKGKKLISFYPDPGRLDHKVFCFYTNKVKKIKKPEKGIKILKLSVVEIKNLIKRGKFNNASHIAALYCYLRN